MYTTPLQHYCPYHLHTPPRHHDRYVFNHTHAITPSTCTITTTTHREHHQPLLLPQSHTYHLHATPFQRSLPPNLCHHATIHHLIIIIHRQHHHCDDKQATSYIRSTQHQTSRLHSHHHQQHHHPKHYGTKQNSMGQSCSQLVQL